ncbi:MAG TPA: tetratricopeptide repeat protein, partial [Kofleriaceae bacterium]
MIRALFVAALLAPAIAIAQPAAGDKVDAQSLMQSGVKLLEAKDYLGALAIFKTAYERFPSAKILLNIGTTLKLLDRDADAANAYQRYLDSNDTDPKRRAEVAKLLAKIDVQVGRVSLAITPSDAITTIDDDNWLHVVHATTWRLAPGHHAIAAHKDGFTPATKSIETSAGESASITLELAPIVVAAPITIAQPVDTGIHATAPVIEAPRSRFGAMVFGNFDIPHGGAALVGATGDITDRIAVRAAVILGPHVGGYVGGVVAILPHRYRPYVSAGLPVFDSNGARV